MIHFDLVTDHMYDDCAALKEIVIRAGFQNLMKYLDETSRH